MDKNITNITNEIKELGNKIEDVYEKITYNYTNELVDDINVIKSFLIDISNSALPIVDFLNDYRNFYFSKKINYKTYIHSVNDLYLLGLQFKRYILIDELYLKKDLSNYCSINKCEKLENILKNYYKNQTLDDDKKLLQKIEELLK